MPAKADANYGRVAALYAEAERLDDATKNVHQLWCTNKLQGKRCPSFAVVDAYARLLPRIDMITSASKRVRAVLESPVNAQVQTMIDELRLLIDALNLRADAIVSWIIDDMPGGNGPTSLSDDPNPFRPTPHPVPGSKV